MKDAFGKRIFTTGEIAKICHVGRSTVARWFDTGRLKGYRLPGLPNRRIPLEYLIKFMKEYGMPIGGIADESFVRVLIIAQDQVLIEELKRRHMSEKNSFKTAVACNSFEAGAQTERFKPDVAVVDFSIGRTEALHICQALRKNSEYSKVSLVVLLPGDGSSLSFDRSQIDEIFNKPFDGELLTNRLMALAEK